VEGALFGLGDLHASMGDGEIGVSGVEVCGSVTVKLEVVKNIGIANPIVKTNDITATIASAITLDEAVTIATQDMANLIKLHSSMAMEEIATLMSAVGNLEISQVVDPEKTARFAMPNEILERLNIQL
jgi:amidase